MEVFFLVRLDIIALKELALQFNAQKDPTILFGLLRVFKTAFNVQLALNARALECHPLLHAIMATTAQRELMYRNPALKEHMMMLVN